MLSPYTFKLYRLEKLTRFTFLLACILVGVGIFSLLLSLNLFGLLVLNSGVFCYAVVMILYAVIHHLEKKEQIWRNTHREIPQ